MGEGGIGDGARDPSNDTILSISRAVDDAFERRRRM